MDEFRKPGNSAPTNYPRPNDEKPGERLGATGVFGASPESIDGDPGPETQEQTSGERGDLQKSAPQAAASREGLQEPIVHKVGLGSGPATAQVDLLELLRATSRKTETVLAPVLGEPKARPSTATFPPAPAPPSGAGLGQSSEGFTQLLRALGGDASPASIAKQPDVVLPTPAGSKLGSTSPESEFTALVRQNASALHGQPEKRPDLRELSTNTAPSDGSGGFTALLQGFPGNIPDSKVRQPNSRPLDESSHSNLPVATRPAPLYPMEQATPGTFTQLFSALTTKAEDPATNPVRANTPAICSENNPVSQPPGGESSFTQLISAIGEGSSKAPAYGDNHPSAMENSSREPSIGREVPWGSSQPPAEPSNWSPATAPQPESSSGIGGLTQLLRTLDEPAKGPEIPVAHPAAGAPTSSTGSGSLFTQTYKKLDEPLESLSPAPQPSYSSPSKVSATQPFASPFTGGTSFAQGTAVSPPPILPAGPSDVTRILDASKLRELQRQGVSAPGLINPVATVHPLSVQVSPPVPPAPPNLQWQPSVPPTPVPGQPAQFGGAMQVPQYTPSAPAPQIPAPAAPPVLGKMQQYLPLMLIIIIFLLIVILVTVIFLLKH